jgi:hypothetical protein
LLAQRSQEAIDIIGELDALERDCAKNGYFLASRGKKDKEKQNTPRLFFYFLQSGPVHTPMAPPGLEGTGSISLA